MVYKLLKSEGRENKVPKPSDSVQHHDKNSLHAHKTVTKYLVTEELGSFSESVFSYVEAKQIPD